MRLSHFGGDKSRGPHDSLIMTWLHTVIKSGSHISVQLQQLIFKIAFFCSNAMARAEAKSAFPWCRFHLGIYVSQIENKTPSPSPQFVKTHDWLFPVRGIFPRLVHKWIQPIWIWCPKNDYSRYMCISKCYVRPRLFVSPHTLLCCVGICDILISAWDTSIYVHIVLLMTLYHKTLWEKKSYLSFFLLLDIPFRPWNIGVIITPITGGYTNWRINLSTIAHSRYNVK